MLHLYLVMCKSHPGGTGFEDMKASINGAGSIGGQHAEECELIHSYLLVLSSTLSGSRTST